jgi:ABC-2 type transport system permease protein
MGEGLAIVIELMIYWYTSKAFSFDPKIGSYFEFVVMGELALLIPTRLIEGVLDPIRNSRNSDFIESIILSKFGLGRFLFTNAFSGVFRELIRIVLYFVILLCFFQVNISTSGVIGFLMIQIFYMPMFLLMGLVLGSILIFFGRGYGAMNKVLLLFVVLSGAYFPQTVLPETLQVLVSKFVPYSAIVSNSRMVFKESWLEAGTWPFILVFVLSTLGCIIVSKMIQNLFLMQIKNDRKFGF